MVYDHNFLDSILQTALNVVFMLTRVIRIYCIFLFFYVFRTFNRFDDFLIGYIHQDIWTAPTMDIIDVNLIFNQ